MKTNTSIKYQILLILSISLCVLCGFTAFSKSSKKNIQRELTETDRQYVECLKDKGITMYGTSWCPHCKEQKEVFGELFEMVNYVDCEEEAGICKKNKVTGYPTWLMPDGKEIQPGSIEEIAIDAGCSLEKSEQTEEEPELNTKSN